MGGYSALARIVGWWGQRNVGHCLSGISPRDRPTKGDPTRSELQTVLWIIGTQTSPPRYNKARPRRQGIDLIPSRDVGLISLSNKETSEILVQKSHPKMLGNCVL